MIPVETSPIAKLTTETATSMMFIGLRNWPSATAHTDGGFSLVISFGPYCCEPICGLPRAESPKSHPSRVTPPPRPPRGRTVAAMAILRSDPRRLGLHPRSTHAHLHTLFTQGPRRMLRRPNAIACVPPCIVTEG